MNVVVTGARGFIGRNLTTHLNQHKHCRVTLFDTHHTLSDLRAALATADIVYHLAGVNRPTAVEEYETGNVGLTRDLCRILSECGRRPVIVMSSSIQAELDNPYGRSKRKAEEVLREFAANTGAYVHIYRLKNVFGKWCRPRYNSVVATFCYNIANELPCHISDAGHEIELVYVDDVVASLLSKLNAPASLNGADAIPSVRLTVGDLAGRIQSFHDTHTNLRTPDFADRFNQQLYATYLTYVPAESRRQQLDIRLDERGGLAEFMKSEAFGQIFVSRTKPGVTRGNHYHHTKTEKFFVIDGEALIRMRQIESSEVMEYRVRGEDFQVIDIPPGYTHSIENVGVSDMVTLFWASQVFDADHPDTYFLPVLAPLENRTSVNA